MTDIEFIAWYAPGRALVRCGGDKGCGAMLVEGDTELHLRWHEKIEESLRHARSVHPAPSSSQGSARWGW